MSPRRDTLCPRCFSPVDVGPDGGARCHHDGTDFYVGAFAMLDAGDGGDGGDAFDESTIDVYDVDEDEGEDDAQDEDWPPAA